MKTVTRYLMINTALCTVLQIERKNEGIIAINMGLRKIYYFNLMKNLVFYSSRNIF